MIPLYVHALRDIDDVFYSMLSGPFGNAGASDLILVQTIQCSLLVYEQAALIHTLQLGFTLPGFIFYVPSHDFLLAQNLLCLHCFRYDTFITQNQSKQSSNWSINLGESCHQALLGQFIADSGHKSLLIVGESTLFVLALHDGSILAQTLLDCQPVSACILSSTSAKSPFLIGATDGSVRIMASPYHMKWRASPDVRSDPPLSFVVDPATGYIVQIDRYGTLSLCYLGTQYLNYTKPIDINQASIHALEILNAELEMKIKKSTKKHNVSKEAIRAELNVKKWISDKITLECCIFGQCSEPLRLTFMLPNWCQAELNQSVYIPYLQEKTTIQFTISIKKNVVPATNLVRFVLTYKQFSAPKIFTGHLHLPAQFAYRAVTLCPQPLKSGVSLSLYSEISIISPHNFIVSEHTTPDEKSAASMLVGFELWNDDQRRIATISCSKTSYRIQATDTSALCLPVYELLERIKLRNYDATHCTHQQLLQFKTELPLADLFFAIENHVALRTEQETLQTKFKRAAKQLESIQKQIEFYLKNSAPAQLQHLECIAKRAHTALLQHTQCLRQISQRKQELAHEICATLGLILFLARAKYHQDITEDFDHYFNMYACENDYGFVAENSVLDWLEHTDASLAFLFDTFLRRNHDTNNAAVTNAATKEKELAIATTASFSIKRHIALVFDYFDRK
mmetsp:Transcript_16073/g.24113  ORF Transcript_16073/g.24113 Transcript_16073/m.24113 type:complete len:682 (+) Transcript_16073:79-2124(+)